MIIRKMSIAVVAVAIVFVSLGIASFVYSKSNVETKNAAETPATAAPAAAAPGTPIPTVKAPAPGTPMVATVPARAGMAPGGTAIPRVLVEYKDEVTGKYPSEMTIEERVDYQKRTEAAVKAAPAKTTPAAKGKPGEKPAIPATPDTTFKMEEVELVSVSKNDDGTKKMVVKAKGGKNVEINAPAYVTATKYMTLDELSAGDKMEVNYIESKEKNDLVNVTIGRRVTMPTPPVAPGAPAAAGGAGMGMPTDRTRGLERLETMVETEKKK